MKIKTEIKSTITPGVIIIMNTEYFERLIQKVYSHSVKQDEWLMCQLLISVNPRLSSGSA